MMISRIFLLSPSRVSWLREFGQRSEAQGGIPGALQSRGLGSVIPVDPFQPRIFHSPVSFPLPAPAIPGYPRGEGDSLSLAMPCDPLASGTGGGTGSALSPQTPPAAPGPCSAELPSTGITLLFRIILVLNAQPRPFCEHPTEGGDAAWNISISKCPEEECVYIPVPVDGGSASQLSSAARPSPAHLPAGI